jgi:thiamine-monophosphate kinase
MNEFQLIANYFNRANKRSDVLLGVGDDAAVLRVPDSRRLVVAVDTIVEGVHFPAGTAAGDIGYRALAVNLSDMAAMGAEPAWVTLSLSLPQANQEWLGSFAKGLFTLADRFHVDLVGGDTVRGPLSIAVQIMGLIEADRWLRRDAAKPGDVIFVSGYPGEAAAGLELIQRAQQYPNVPVDAKAKLLDRFLRPQPRVELGRSIRTLANAAIDVSDGLVGDLNHICEMSGCSAHVDLEALPKSPAMQACFDASRCEQMTLAGGDDYELVFTVPQQNLLAVESMLANHVRCTPIGRMVPSQRANHTVQCYRQGEVVHLASRSYNHFEQ